MSVLLNPGDGTFAPMGAYSVVADNAQRAAREANVFSRRGTIDEIRMLEAICGHLGINIRGPR